MYLDFIAWDLAFNTVATFACKGIPHRLLIAYLSLQEIDEVLEIVQDEADYSFLYPMMLMAAHSGAHRSELRRSEESDFDIEAGIVVIREKKLAKSHRTTRQVPLSDQLAAEMKAWFADTSEVGRRSRFAGLEKCGGGKDRSVGAARLRA